MIYVTNIIGVFWGALALFFVTFGFGALIFPYRKAELNYFLLYAVIASLTISWLMAVIAYWSGMDTIIIRLIILLCFIGLIIRMPKIQLFVSTRFSWGMLAATTYCFVLFYSLSQPPIEKFFFAQRLTLVFHWSDALSSWNRWAIQLATRQFYPYDNFYPVGWPGIWSLIYRIQENAVFWFFSKASLFANHFSIIIVLALVVQRMNLFIALPLVFFSTSFFGFTNAWPATSGYMDMPVSMLGFLGLAALFLYFHEINYTQKSETFFQPNLSLLLLAALFFGFAVVTKQAGILLFLILAMTLLVLVLHKKIRLIYALFLLLIACIPGGLYLVLYLTSEVDQFILAESVQRVSPSFFGLLERFSSFATSRGYSLGLPISAAQVVNAGFIPGVFYGLVATSAANLIYAKRLQGQFGLIVFFFGLIGFFVFASCCAYDARNGFWLFPIFAIASLNAFNLLMNDLKIILNRPREHLLKVYPAHYVVLSISVAFALVVLALAFVAGREGLDDWNERQIQRLTSTAFYKLLENKLPPVENDTLLGNIDANEKSITWAVAVTEPKLLYLKPIRGHAVLCRGKDAECAKALTQCFDKTYVISTPTDGYYNFNSLTEKLATELLLGSALRRERSPYTPHEFQVWGPIPKTKSATISNSKNEC